MRRKMRFTFPDIDKELYGKHAKNMMKTDVRDNGDRYDNTKNKLNSKLLFDCIWKNESGYAILNVWLNA